MLRTLKPAMDDDMNTLCEIIGKRKDKKKINELGYLSTINDTMQSSDQIKQEDRLSVNIRARLLTFIKWKEDNETGTLDEFEDYMEDDEGKKCYDEIKAVLSKRATELHDIELFKSPPTEDCPICFQRLPTLNTGRQYNSCCGMTICSGCSYAPVYDNQGNTVAERKCAFCRVPSAQSKEEAVERLKERMEIRDPLATFNMACYYKKGTNGYQHDYTKALELFHCSADLGDPRGYNGICVAYELGHGVEVNKKKARHYFELAAVGGDELSRCNLGNIEMREGNADRALRHYMIAVRCGFLKSLKIIQEMYSHGHATKEDYSKALQSYQTYLEEIKSDRRDKAAAADEKYRYYQNLEVGWDT